MNPKLKKGLNITLAVVECAIILVVTILVNYYGIFPAMLKNHYISKIETAIERYVETQQDFYNIQLVGSVDNNAVLTGYFLGKKQGGFATGEYYYYMLNDIKEKVTQTSGKNVYNVYLYTPNSSKSYNVATDIENFTDLKSLLQFQLSDLSGQLNSTRLPTDSSGEIVDKKDLYIRKTKDGFYIELNTDSTNVFGKDNLTDYKIPKKLKGSVRIVDGVITKIQLYMNTKNKLSGEKSLIKIDMDFKNSTQSITKPDLRNYTIVHLDKKVDKANFVKAISAGKKEITNSTIANDFITDTPLGHLYKDKLYCVVMQNNTLSLKVVNPTEFSQINSVEILTLKSSDSKTFAPVFVDDFAFVFIDKDNMLYKINLDTLESELTQFSNSLDYDGAFETYKSGNKIILSNVGSNSHKFYEINLDPFAIKYNRGYSETYQYGNYLYYGSTYQKTISKYDILNNQVTTVGACEDFSRILFAGKQGIVYITTNDEIKIFGDNHILAEYLGGEVVTEDDYYLYVHYPKEEITLKFQNGELVKKCNIDTKVYAEYVAAHYTHYKLKFLYDYQDNYYFSNLPIYVAGGESISIETLNSIAVEEPFDAETKKYCYRVDYDSKLCFELGNKVISNVGDKYLVLYDKNDLITPICYVEAELQYCKIAGITLLKLDNLLYRI